MKSATSKVARAILSSPKAAREAMDVSDLIRGRLSAGLPISDEERTIQVNGKSILIGTSDLEYERGKYCTRY